MLKKIWSNKPLIGLIIFAVIVSVLNPRFLTHANILNVLRQTSINSIIAIGMTLVILTGGIDLSVGSILAFCGAVMASLLNAGHNPILALIVTLALGLVFGFFNGFLVSKMKLQAFIVTLVTMTFLRGATLVFTEGKPITVDDGGLLFENIGGGYLFDIPIPIYIMIALFVAGHYLLMHTKFGRYTYAIGGNEEATKLSGINVDKVKMWVYGLCGMLSALAGVILTSRLYSAQPTAGSGYELDAIAAVVLGGEMAGNYIVEKLNGAGKVVELEGIPGTTAARDRGEGFNKAVNGKLTTVAKQAADFDRTRGLTVMENILQAQPEIDAVFAHNDEMALGALKAIEASGRDILVVGFDATDDAVASVKEGKMGATVAQKPAEIGAVGVEVADKIIKKEEVPANVPVALELIVK